MTQEQIVLTAFGSGSNQRTLEQTLGSDGVLSALGGVLVGWPAQNLAQAEVQTAAAESLSSGVIQKFERYV